LNIVSGGFQMKASVRKMSACLGVFTIIGWPSFTEQVWETFDAYFTSTISFATNRHSLSHGCCALFTIGLVLTNKTTY